MRISYRHNGVYRCVRGSTAIAGIQPLEKTLGPWETNDGSWSWSALPTVQRKRLLAPPQTRPHHGQTAAHWVCLCGAQAPDRESQSPPIADPAALAEPHRAALQHCEDRKSVGVGKVEKRREGADEGEKE